MSQRLSIEEALRDEFACHYLADELPTTWDDVFLAQKWPARAEASAKRLNHKVDADKAQELAVLLRDAAGTPTHPIIAMICDVTSIEWTESADWPVLQRLLSLIADKL